MQYQIGPKMRDWWSMDTLHMDMVTALDELIALRRDVASMRGGRDAVERAAELETYADRLRSAALEVIRHVRPDCTCGGLPVALEHLANLCGPEMRPKGLTIEFTLRAMDDSEAAP
jgi:hypothetical protein